MASDRLRILAEPTMTDPVLVLGFTGWMDGGDVSTGTVQWLTEQFGAVVIGEIEPDDFYIYNFPGPMEVASLFRPMGKIEAGLVTEFEWPTNTFYCDPRRNLVLFEGKEPNLHWRDFADCIFAMADAVGVRRVFFVGSVGGLVTHTREPRIFSSVSAEGLKRELAAFGIRFSDYEGPMSLVTYLMVEAPRRELEVITLVAEIPAYVQGRNPKSIEAVIRKLTTVIGQPIELDTLRAVSDEWEKRVTEVVLKRDDLAKYIGKLEEDYDNEVFDTQMGDLKDWLEEQGIRLD